MGTFAERLKELREEAGISMQQLGAAIDASDAAICKWEHGEVEPKACYITRLADYFDCTADYLLGRADDFGGLKPSQATGKFMLTTEERGLITTYRALAPNMRNIVNSVFDACSSDLLLLKKK